MSDPTQDQWVRLMSAVDQARADVTPSIDMSAFEVALEGEVACEWYHGESHCTGRAQWSAPETPCGCLARRPACQGAYDLVMHQWGERLTYCDICNKETLASEWRKGWWPL